MIGAGAAVAIVTITQLFMLLSQKYGFVIYDLTGDIRCEGVLEYIDGIPDYSRLCISDFIVYNPNSSNVDIYNKNQTKLEFSPEIYDYALFVRDARCGAMGGCACVLKDGMKLGQKGWRCTDFTNRTKPREDMAYNFRFPARFNTSFRLMGLKKDPKDNVKWSFGLGKDILDPLWMGSGSSNAMTISHISAVPVESYTFECTGNETVLCPYISYEIIKDKGNWTRTDFKIELDRTDFVKDSEHVKLPGYYDLRAGDEKAMPVPVFPALDKASGNIKPGFEKGDTMHFDFTLPANTGWAKFGDNSIYIIQGADVVSSSILTNVTVEDVIQNFSHLTPVSPISMGLLKGINVSGNMTLRNLSPYFVDDTMPALNLYDGTGTDGYVTIGTVQNLSDVCVNGCSFSAWAEAKDATPAGTMIAKYDTTNNDAFFSMFLDSAADTDFTITVNGTATSGGYCNVDYTSSDVVPNRWYHFVAVYSNATGIGSITVFRDGVNITWKTCPAYFTGINYSLWTNMEAGSENVYIGGQDDGTTPPGSIWNGSIKNVLVWNRALTSAEVLSLYNLGKADTTYTDANLVRAYRFTDPSVLVAVDDTGNQNGTFYGTSWYSFDNSGLLSYYPFDGERVNNLSTRVYDWNGKWDATLTNGNTVFNSSCGLYGNGVCFDGNGDWIYLGAFSDLELTDNFSVMAWVKTSGATTTTLRSIFDMTDGGIDTLKLSWNTTQDLIFNVTNSSGISNAVSYVDGITNANWHHVAGVYNGTAIMVYVDGVAGGSSPLTGKTSVTNSQLEIGLSSATGGWNGSMDEMMMFDRAVTADEIATIIVNQSHRFREPGKQILMPVNFWQNGSWNRLNVTTSIQENMDTNISLKVGLMNKSLDNQTGLIMFINAEEGTSYDWSGNGNNGTTSSTIIAAGRNGTRGLDLSKGNDAVIINHQANQLLTSGGTISTWFYVSPGISQTPMIVCKGPTDGFAFYISMTTTSALNAIKFNINNTAVKSDNNSITTNKWIHAAATWDADGYTTIYVNGMVNGTSGYVNSANNITSTSTMYLGECSGGAYDLWGYLDDVMIFNRTLSASEIYEIYSSQNSNYSGVIYYNEDIKQIDNGTTQFSMYGNTSFSRLEYGMSTDTYSFYSAMITDMITVESWAEAGTPVDNPPTYSLNSTNTTVAGAWTLFSEKWGDETGLSGYIFGIDNCTGTEVNDSFASFSGVSNHSNVTKWVNATVGCTVNYCIYANDSIDQWNSTCMSYVTTQEVVGDSCDTCAIDCTENCVIDAALDCDGGRLTFMGAGMVAIQAMISNFNYVYIGEGCNVRCDPGAGCGIFDFT